MHSYRRSGRFALLLALLGAGGCETLLPGPTPASTPQAVFDAYWEGYDNYYAGFAFARLNWDSVRTALRPQALAATSDQQLARVLDAATRGLRDPHVVLEMTTAGSLYYGTRLHGWHNTLPAGQLLANYVTLRPDLSNGPLTFGTLRRDPTVGYLAITSFASTNNSYPDIDRVTQALAGLRGLVVDVRDNGGGSEDNARQVASRLVTTEAVYELVRFRGGPNRHQLSDYQPKSLAPGGSGRFTQPLVVLTNRYTASAAEDFVLMLRAQARGVQLGDTTAGAGNGRPIARELPNGWRYSVPTTVTYLPNRQRTGTLGIVPQQLVRLLPADSLAGRDTLLEQALRLL